jgi:hypothetical protein
MERFAQGLFHIRQSNIIGAEEIDDNVGPEDNDAVLAATGAAAVDITTPGAMGTEVRIEKLVYPVPKFQIGPYLHLQASGFFDAYAGQQPPGLKKGVPLF